MSKDARSQCLNILLLTTILGHRVFSCLKSKGGALDIKHEKALISVQPFYQMRVYFDNGRVLLKPLEFKILKGDWRARWSNLPREVIH